jgi:hypothetical protein
MGRVSEQGVCAGRFTQYNVSTVAPSTWVAHIRPPAVLGVVNTGSIR